VLASKKNFFLCAAHMAMSVEEAAPLQQVMCGGEWGVGGQNLDCSLRDLLFDTQFIAQVFDWQNAVFLLFFPLMLLISSVIFRLTFKAFGAKGACPSQASLVSSVRVRVRCGEGSHKRVCAFRRPGRCHEQRRGVMP